jgi:predicted transcriptional regulator
MSRSLPPPLSRRERQMMDILYQRGRATAAEVQASLPDPPTYSAVRGLLRVLETKGHIRHDTDGSRYVYAPVAPRSDAARSALAQVLRTFFGGSVEDAVSTLVTEAEMRLTDEELDRLSDLIEKARKEGR